MTASTTPREVIVEYDGLYFRIQKLRGRRACRAELAVKISLGQAGHLTLSQPRFWEADEETQLRTLMSLEVQTEPMVVTTANGTTVKLQPHTPSYDQVEAALEELVVYTPDSGGQGVSYRESEPDPERPAAGWVPIRNASSLDAYDRIDHTTWKALRWEVIKLVYRPTTAAAGTRADTQSAAMTSMPAKSRGGEPKTLPTGLKRAETPLSGITGG